MDAQRLFAILNSLCSYFMAVEISIIKTNTGLPVLVLSGFVDVDV